jgi:hypothetical protein
LSETGSFNRREGQGRTRTVSTSALEERVLQEIADNSSTSTRAVAASVGVSRHVVRNVIADDDLHPYHYQRVQALQPPDYAPRLDFCRWFLGQMEAQPDLPGLVFFTDEATFTQEGVFNIHNRHCWAHENPHITHAHAHQTRFSVNVWAGIVGDNLIGPYLFPDRLDGRAYLNFLTGILPGLLGHIPGDLLSRMWFQHDGAPAHFSREVRDHLNDTFGDRWIGRGGPVAWPPRSPDLTSLDFFLWGHMKSLVYETPIPSREDLVARIVAAGAAIQDTPNIFENVRQSIIRRYNTCILVGGRTFEQFL